MEVIERKTGKIKSCHLTRTLIQAATEALHRAALQEMQQELSDLGPKPSLHTDDNSRASTTSLTTKDLLERSETQREVFKWQNRESEIHRLERTKVILESPVRTAQISDIGAISSLKFPSDLNKVEVETGDSLGGYSGTLVLDLDNPNSSRYSIKGRDAQSLNGVTKTLDDLFRDNETAHHFLHRESFSFLIAVLLTMLISWISVRGLMIGGLLHLPNGLTAIGGAVTVFGVFSIMPIWWLGEKFLRWQFPYFTYEEDKRNKRRRAIKGVFIFVVGGLLVSFIVDLVRLLIMQ